MALLPGSPAIDAGSNGLAVDANGNPLTTDQRGQPRIVNHTVDIGAFESSGFTVTVTSGNSQATGALTAFSAPLVATVTSNNPSEPVAGGLVTFTAPPSGASATLSGSPATISANGEASVTAAANSIVGTYTVSATASGITTPASFSLTNVWVPTFSALTSPTIVYGTSTITLTGHLGSGTAYPTGSNVSIMLISVTQTALVDSNGDFTTTFSTVSLGVAGGPYTVTYAFAGNSTFIAATDTSTTLTVTAAPLTASIIGDPTKTYDGTTSATLTQANFSLSGLAGTQSFTVTQAVGTYNSKDVTAATTVMASLTSSVFTPEPGTLASNYILPTTASGAGNINPALLTVTAAIQSMTYGGAVPALIYTYTGLVNGETSATFTGGLATAAASSSSVGSYPITLGTLAATGNYTIGTFVPGTLTVAMATDGLIIVLDPSASGALSLSGNASINVSGVIYVDSSSSSALSAAGNAKVKASAIDVHGGVQKTGNASLSPTPITGAQTLADPLSGLALPSTSGMKSYGTEKLSGNSSATIQPGIYSQITVSGNAKLTLSSGTYILEGGGFSVSGNASVSGSGVMIVNAGSNYPSMGGAYGSISLGGNGSSNLSPLSTGTYAGIAILQPGDNTSSLSISGNALDMTGAIYAPKAQLIESGNGQLNSAIVVGTMTVSGNGIDDIRLLDVLPGVAGRNVATRIIIIASAPVGAVLSLEHEHRSHGPGLCPGRFKHDRRRHSRMGHPDCREAPG